MKNIASLALLSMSLFVVASTASAQASLPAPKSAPVVTVLGTIDLGKEFAGMAGNSLILRTITVAPGGGLGLHSHKGKPEVLHIVSGVLSEQRNGGPIVQDGPGATVINDGSVTHALVNLGAVPVEMISATIAPSAQPSPPKP